MQGNLHKIHATVPRAPPSGLRRAVQLQRLQDASGLDPAAEYARLKAADAGLAAGDGAVNAVGPVFADFKAARISDNADSQAVITLGEGHRITLLGVAGDDLTVANFAFV